MTSSSVSASRFRIRGLATVCAAALAMAACGGPDGGESTDTSDVGTDILLSTERGTTGITEPGQAPMTRGQPPPASLRAPTNEIPIGQLGHTMGDPGAPIRVLEFSDFACGYCRQFHMDVFPSLEEEFIETGKVQWKYVPMLLGAFGPNADLAARAGECALAQDRFPAMRDLLFENQGQWRRAGDATSIFEGYADDIGLDVDEWRACVEEDQRRDRIASGTTAAFRAGLRGTPTFFIIGYAPVHGSLPLEVFRMVLDTVYADATSGQPTGGAEPSR